VFRIEDEEDLPGEAKTLLVSVGPQAKKSPKNQDTQIVSEQGLPDAAG
jgi:hypothetical protein